MSDTTDSNEKFEEEMLKSLFMQCDSEIRTGHVKSVDLINAIQGYVNEPIDPRLMDQLTTLMDPQKDNSYLSVDEFVRVGKQWLEIVIQTKNEEMERSRQVPPKLPLPKRRAIPVPLSQIGRSKSQSLIPVPKFMASPKKPALLSDSSLGILGIHQMEMTTYSDDNDDLDKSQDSSNVSQRIDLLARELEGLRKCNKKLTEEKSLLETQFLASEDALSSLQREHDDLKVQLRNLENVSEMKAELESKLNAQSESLTESERRFTSMRTDLDRFHDLSDSLGNENTRLKEELERCQESLNVARMNCGDSCAVVDELTKKLDELKLEIAERALAMEDLETEKRVLVSKLNETQQMNERLEAEIELCKSQVVNGIEHSKPWDETATDPSVDPAQLFGESLDQSEAFLDDVFKKPGNGNAGGPSAVSTPYAQKFTRPIRGSIGDEILKLGVEGSPLCDKKLKKETADASTQTDDIPELKPEVFEVEAAPRQDVDRFSRLVILSSLALVTILAFFTFFGGVDFGTTKLYPITWSASRGWPEPFNAFKIRRRLDCW